MPQTYETLRFSGCSVLADLNFPMLVRQVQLALFGPFTKHQQPVGLPRRMCPKEPSLA